MVADYLVRAITQDGSVRAFRCSCSRERVEKALISLGREELASLLEQQEEIAVTCEFCHEEFVFSREELKQLLEEMELS